jgi:hypothetical protein
MWFAKWFGGRKEEDPETDEPARFAAPPTPAPQESATMIRKKQASSGNGFDPYNSGSFEKRNAWERVSKR